jgi:two-component system sensor histidine kinase KdpD
MSYNNLYKIIRSAFYVFLFIGCASIVGYLFNKIGFPETNIVIIYILSVLLTARLTEGYLYGILASIIATFSFNYFFTAPLFTFSVSNPDYIITFIIMTITAIITSALTSRVKQNVIDVEKRERETRALYQLTNRLTEASDIHAIANISTGVISDVFKCNVACLCFDNDGIPEHTFVQQLFCNMQTTRSVDNVMEIKRQAESVNGEYYINEEFYDWPIHGKENILGIVRIPKDKVVDIDESQKRLLRTMIESTALAMDRFRQLQKRIQSNEEMVQERYRGNLLRAISHDIRTPLSGIMGTSEIIMDMTPFDDSRYELAKVIFEDADWLRALVENILNLTKLQEGRLVIKKEIEAVEEIVGSAVRHISRRSPEYNISIKIPKDLLLVPMDAKLIEQVIINLLDNAIKHSKPQNEIIVLVKVRKELNSVEFSIIDSGIGIKESDLPNIFKMFYTSKRRIDIKNGIGLGLTICEAIVNAHGGKIKACNRTDESGSILSFTLPMKE